MNGRRARAWMIGVVRESPNSVARAGAMMPTAAAIAAARTTPTVQAASSSSLSVCSRWTSACVTPTSLRLRHVLTMSIAIASWPKDSGESRRARMSRRKK